MSINIPERCKNCGEYFPHFTWDHVVGGASGIVDGRHRIGEMTVQVFLGCNHCSETLIVMPLDEWIQEAADYIPVRLVRERSDTQVSQPPNQETPES